MLFLVAAFLAQTRLNFPNNQNNFPSYLLLVIKKLYHLISFKTLKKLIEY